MKGRNREVAPLYVFSGRVWIRNPSREDPTLIGKGVLQQ